MQIMALTPIILVVKPVAGGKSIHKEWQVFFSFAIEDMLNRMPML
jgi:hypothetical protein